MSNGDELLNHKSPRFHCSSKSRSAFDVFDGHGTANVLTSVLEDSIITINVSGELFQTRASTLARYPRSLLGDPERRLAFWHPEMNCFFFDRHRKAFEGILYIYQSHGVLQRPFKVPIDLFVAELQFFDMGQRIMDAFWVSEGYEKPIERPMPKNRVQRKVWELFEHGDSSNAARCIAAFSVAVIILSIVTFCLETVDKYRDKFLDGNGQTKVDITNPFYIGEVFCIGYFTFELLIRFASCPNKWQFWHNILNIIDLVSILPFYINIPFSDGDGKGSELAMLRVIRLVRVFRVFKLSRHSIGLQILGKTMAASLQEFLLLFFFLVMALVLFSSGLYFVENSALHEGDETATKFTSIPATFWFVLVTMTTVGYGDMVPLTGWGKLIGSLCSLFGVLTIAMPVPIIVANFKHFYEQETRLAALRHAYPSNKNDTELMLPPDYTSDG